MTIPNSWDEVLWSPAFPSVERPSAIGAVRIPNLVVVDEEARVQVRIGNFIIVDDHIWTFLHPAYSTLTRPIVIDPGNLFRVSVCSDLFFIDITELCEWKLIEVADNSMAAEAIRLMKNGR